MCLTHSLRAHSFRAWFLSCFYKRQSAALLYLSWLCPRMCLRLFVACSLQTLHTHTSVEQTTEALWSVRREVGRAMSPRLQNGRREREREKGQGPPLLREIFFSSPPWGCRCVTTAKASVTPAAQSLWSAAGKWEIECQWVISRNGADERVNKQFWERKFVKMLRSTGFAARVTL